VTKIELSGVWVEFPIREKWAHGTHAALRDINLVLKKGDRLGITGSNGSGKTTLLRLINGIYPPTRGTATVQGAVGSMLDIYLGITGKLSGRDNIIYRSQILGRSRSSALETVEDACDFGGLGDFIDQPVETYSSGMKMRLAFSIATATPAQIFVMDEWLSVGDESFQAKAQARLDDLVHKAEILVLASHNKKLLRSACNRFLKMEKGIATEVSNIDRE
jgi:lipopolysaccharide transport system ATP-binding protein